MWRRCLCILQSGILEHNTHGEDVNTYIVHSLLEEGYLSVCHKSAEWKHQHWRSPRQQVPTHKCMEQVAPPFNFLSKQWDSAVDHMRWAGYGWRRVTLIYASSVSHLLHRWCLLICHSVMLPPKSRVDATMLKLTVLLGQGAPRQPAVSAAITTWSRRQAIFGPQASPIATTVQARDPDPR